MRRRILIVGLCVCIVTTLIASRAKGEVQRIKFGTCMGGEELWKGGPAHPYYYVGQHVMKRFAELTNGRIKVDFYPRARLGGDREMLEMTIAGTLETALICHIPMAMFIKEIGVFDLPYAFKAGYKTEELKELWTALDGPFGQYLTAKGLEKGFRIVGVGFTDTVGIMTRNKPIYKMEDLKGLKIRTMESPIQIATIKAFGAKPIPMPWPEVYMALAQGVIDGIYTCLPPSVGESQWEQYKYYAETHTSLNLRVVVLSEKWFQSLSPEDQLNALQVGWEAALMMRYAPAKIYEKCIEFIKSKGITITHPPREPMIEACAKIRPEFMEKIGGKYVWDFVQAAKEPPELPKLELH